MWRYYIRNRTATVDVMTASDFQNWVACNAVYKEMDHAAQDVITAVSTSPIGQERDAVFAWANQNCVQPNVVWDIVKDAYKQSAIERGLIEQYPPGRVRQICRGLNKGGM